MTTTSATTSTGPKGFRWLYLILGIVLFVFGVGIIRHPVASYFGLAMYFSIVIIVIGISEIMNAFAGGNSRHWGMGTVHRVTRPNYRFYPVNPPDHHGRHTSLHRRLYPHVQKH